MLFIDLGKESAGCTAKLYYYNRDVEELEFLCAGEIAEDGMAGLTFTHASDYVIVVERGAEDTDKTGSDGTTEEEMEPGHEETEITGGGKIILFLLAGVIVILAAGKFPYKDTAAIAKMQINEAGTVTYMRSCALKTGCPWPDSLPLFFWISVPCFFSQSFPYKF